MVVSSACLRLKPYGIESTQEQKFNLDTGQCCASHRSQTLHVPVRVQSGAQLSLVAQSCPTLGDPMDCSTAGLPVHHQLPELAQTHVHRVGDAVQPSHPVIPFSSCPQSFPALESFPMCQFFTSGGQNIGVSASASVLPVNIQDRSPLGWTGWISLHSKGLSRVFSNTTVQKHQFFGAQLSL